MKNLFFLVFGLIALISCADENTVSNGNFLLENLHNNYIKLWKISKIEVKGLVLDEPEITDEYFIFDNFNHGFVVYGENDFISGDTITFDAFEYEIFANGTEIKLVGLKYGNKIIDLEDFKILNLTKDELIIEYKTDFFNQGEMNDTKLYFKSEVETNVNADIRNAYLTHRNVKLWKFTSVSINGVAETRPDCRLDDYFLFATNGFGIRIFGDTHCIPGDTVNNDLFLWNFTDDSTAIIRKELHPFWSHEEGNLVVSDTMQILNLTDDEFKFAASGYLNNEVRNVILTFTNYFK